MTREGRLPEFQLVMARYPEPVPCVTLTLTLEEAAQSCGLSSDTLRAFITDGRLKAKRTSEGGGRRADSRNAGRAEEVVRQALPDA